MKLTKGPQKCPVRAVIYSPEGRGKTTLASLLPAPVFIDVEGGTHQLDVVRCEPSTWTEALAAVEDIAKNHAKEFKTVVFDTADWLERLCTQDLCARSGKKSIEDFGYGKGYTFLVEEFDRILKYAERLVSLGFNVVFLAHSKVVRTSPPDQTDGFDRYELKLSKQVAPLLKEWADLILFANVEMVMVTGSDGKVKAQGGKARVLHTVGTAAWDAKNRYGLPETLPMEKDALAPELLRVFFDQVRPTVCKPDVIPGLVGDDTVPPSTAVNTSPVHAPKAPVATGDISEPKQIEVPDFGGEPVAVPGKFADAQLAAMFGGQEAPAHAFLVFAKWLTEDQPLSALSADRVATIKARPAAFAAKAKLTVNQGVA